MNRISITLIIVVLLLATMMFTSCGEPAEHVCSYDIKGATVKATCVSYGYTEYACECGAKVQQDIVDSAAAHKFVETDKVEATCISEGLLTETCSVCGFFKNTTIPATEKHTVDEWVEFKQGTCTDAGSAKGICTVCKETQYKETTTHEFVIDTTKGEEGWEVKTPASCANEGVKVAYCALCGKSKTETIPTEDHDYVADVIREATCVVDGLVKYSCSACGDGYAEEIKDPDAHNMELAGSSEATCIRAGWTLYTCTNLGCDHYYYEDYVEAKHQPGEPNVIKSTCTVNGSVTVCCTVCGEQLSQEFTGYLEHDYESKEIDPTCLEFGYTLHMCRACGDIYKDNYVMPVDHAYEQTGWVEAPTECLGTGIALLECTTHGCGASKKEEVTIDEHIDFVVEVIVPGDYTNGYEIEHCQCGAISNTTVTEVPTKSSKVEFSVHKYFVDGVAVETAIITGIVEESEVVVIPYKVADADGNEYIVTGIDYNLFFGATGIKEVYLPGTITNFYTAAFWYAEGIEVIYFDGTVEEWNAIDNDPFWDRGMGAYTIVCEDGKINQYGTVTYKD